MAVPKATTTPSTLSPARRQLVALMQRINFGRVEHLAVRAGEPVLDPMPRVVLEHKFGGENGPRPEAGRSDFALKAQVVDLFHLLDRVRDGTLPVLSIKHGVPFLAEVAG